MQMEIENTKQNREEQIRRLNEYQSRLQKKVIGDDRNDKGRNGTRKN